MAGDSATGESDILTLNSNTKSVNISSDYLSVSDSSKQRGMVVDPEGLKNSSADGTAYFKLPEVQDSIENPSHWVETTRTFATRE